MSNIDSFTNSVMPKDSLSHGILIMLSDSSGKMGSFQIILSIRESKVHEFGPQKKITRVSLFCVIYKML